MKYTYIGLFGVAVVAIMGTTYLAEGAEPGSLLYGYKTQINDRLSGWFAVEYVADVNLQIDAIEDKLQEIEALVVAGELTPDQAAELKNNLLAHIEAAQTTIDSSNTHKLTPAQIKQLNDGLNRLKSTLVRYRSTLTVLETTAEKSVKTNVNKKKVADVIADTVSSIEIEMVEAIELLDETEDTTSIDNEVSDIIDEYSDSDTEEVSDQDDQNQDETEVTDETTEETSDETTSTDGEEIIEGDASEATTTEATVEL